MQPAQLTPELLEKNVEKLLANSQRNTWTVTDTASTVAHSRSVLLMEDLVALLSVQTTRRLHLTVSVSDVIDVPEANVMDEPAGLTPATSGRLLDPMAGANPATTTASLSLEQA